MVNQKYSGWRRESYVAAYMCDVMRPTMVVSVPNMHRIVLFLSLFPKQNSKDLFVRYYMQSIALHENTILCHFT